VASALANLRRDSDPSVRKAAIESLGAIGGAPAVDTALALLRDPVWFVRAHAARALGEMKRADLARELLPLLSDGQWWVRAATKDALLAMGKGVAETVGTLLDHPDRFARNGAAEVLQNLGILDDLAARAVAGGDDAGLALLRKAAAAGGAALSEGIVSRAAPGDSGLLRAMLAEGGEASTA
jgi:HEAT repeat protein